MVIKQTIIRMMMQNKGYQHQGLDNFFFFLPIFHDLRMDRTLLVHTTQLRTKNLKVICKINITKSSDNDLTLHIINH